MQLNNRIRRKIEVIEQGWPAGLPQAPTMADRLTATIKEFCSANVDGRGTTNEALRTVDRTLKHLQSAMRYYAAGRPKALAREARKLLTSLQHNATFELTIMQARRFAGEVQKYGKRSARQAPVCAPAVSRCGTLRGGVEIRLCRVVSVDDLKEVGRTLDLCVAHDNDVGRPYHVALCRGIRSPGLLTSCGCPPRIPWYTSELVNQATSSPRQRARAVDPAGAGKVGRVSDSDERPVPDFDRIEAANLRDDERLPALYVDAVRRGFWPNSPQTALEFAAYAEKALADDTLGTPGRLFYGLVMRRDGAMVRQSAEDRAMARFPSRARQEVVDEAPVSAISPTLFGKPPKASRNQLPKTKSAREKPDGISPATPGS